jgi:uncharacterized protein (DUF2141 family)
MSGGTQIALLVRWGLATLFVVFLIAIYPQSMANAGIGTIEARIVRLRNDRGQVICTLFTPADGFPEKSHKGMTIAVPIQGGGAICRFKDVQYGSYAIVAFHDENHDGEFNQNWLGMPKEGFGFSNNPGTLRKPVFDDAKFTVDRPLIDVTIRLNYWF